MRSDLACLMVDQLERAVQGENKGMGAGNIIEIGGAKTVTPFEQSQMIFAAAGVEPRYVRVPLALLDLVEGAVCSVEAALLALREALGTKKRLARSAWHEKALEAVANAAESTRIAKFYATADMLGPSDLMYSSEALKDFYAGAVKSAKEVSDEDLGLPASSLLASRILRGGLPLLATTIGSAAFLSKLVTSTTAEISNGPLSAVTVLSANFPEVSAEVVHHTNWM